MHRRFYLTLSLISAAVFLSFALFVAYKEATPEWKKYQTEYKKLFIRKARDGNMREKGESLDIGIQQIYLERLKRVDRCTNCHAGVENPLMAGAEVPYKQHSGNYLKDHPTNRFGCTVCHYGQGYATNKKEAHGEGRDTHWDYPIIPLRYIQSSCVQCHDLDMLKRKHGELVVKGEELFRIKGCKGCHKLSSVGGVLGRALDGVGSQPIAHFPMKYVKGDRTIYSWLKQHFDNPRSIVPESQMKVDLTDNEANLLTTYMLSMRSEEMPREYKRIKDIRTWEETTDGKLLYKINCIACHGTGRDSVDDKIFGRTIPAIMDPAFLRTANDRFLKRVIEEGRQGTQMTAWKTDAAGLSNEEINRIIGYITKDRPTVARQSISGRIVAKKVTEDIPLDPEHILWKHTSAFEVPLMLIGKKPDPMDRLINVKSLYNDIDIAFLVEWKDATMNVSLDVDAFRDGVALQFPMRNAIEPSFRMGHGGRDTTRGIVNIWFWRADVQGSINKGMQPDSQGPVENLAAIGFGTLTSKDKVSLQVYGKGKWKHGKWSVVFKRRFIGDQVNAGFTRGEIIPVSFAVWDGSEEDVAGRKAVSAWYYVVSGE